MFSKKIVSWLYFGMLGGAAMILSIQGCTKEHVQNMREIVDGFNDVFSDNDPGEVPDMVEAGDADVDEPRVTAQTRSPFDEFLGVWVNPGRNQKGEMTRLVIRRSGDNQVTFQGFGQCEPKDCNWGRIKARMTAKGMAGVYNLGQKRRMVSLQQSGNNQLKVLVIEKDGLRDRRPETKRYTLERRMNGVG